MTETPRNLLREIAVIGLASLAIAACSPQQGELGDEFFPHAKWEQIPPSPENMVEVVTLRHVVSFGAGDSSLGQSQRGSLDDFIRRNRVHQDDEILVQSTSGQGDRVAQGRLIAVRNEIARLGLVAADAHGTASPGVGGNAVEVLVTRAVVIPPDCQSPQPKPTLRPESRWGCSTNAALGMMVANPQDLIEGRDLGPADGEQAVKALQRYRADKVKQIKSEETTN